MRRRGDISDQDVALRWIAGESIQFIATSLRAAPATIHGRLTKARKTFPDLPWGERVIRRTPSPTKSFAAMNDGKQGAAEARGSIVDGRRRKHR